jgi:hypothetical protein
MWRLDMVRKMHCLALAVALSVTAGSVVTSTSAEAGFLLDAVKEGVTEGVKEGVKQVVTEGVKQSVTDGMKRIAAKREEIAKKSVLRTQQQYPPLRQRPRQTSFANR